MGAGPRSQISHAHGNMQIPKSISLQWRKQSELWAIGHVRYINIQAWLRGFQVADPDLELRGGPRFDLLTPLAFLPSVRSFFNPK